MKSIQVSPLTGNGLSNLQRICAALKLLQPPTNNSYNNILKRVVEASCRQTFEKETYLILSTVWFFRRK